MRTIMVAAALCLPLAGPLPAQAASGCGDLLAELAPRPRSIVFVDCRHHPDLQTKPNKARYRVSGRDARAAETFLRRKFRAEALAFRCCGWEMRPGSFRKPETGRSFEISMWSDETLSRDFDAIAQFHIEVTEHTEAP